MNKQIIFNLNKGRRGGRRSGAGRPRVHSKGVAHCKRPKVSGKIPLHVNFKVRFSIRNKDALKYLKRAILRARARGLNIVHFTLQSNHIHLLVEATDNSTLSSGMRALTVSFSKSMGKGKIQLERYHLHVLKTLSEVKNALRYVLLNEQKNTQSITLKVDDFY